MGAFFFFAFLAAVIIVPQVLRYNERGRLHETLRMAFERGQPVPPELIDALRYGRRRWAGADGYDPGFAQAQASAAAWRAQTPPPPSYAASPDPLSSDPLFPTEPAATAATASSMPPLYAPRPLAQRDLRRGLVWLAIGVGLVAAGAAFYAGLYDVGGAPETFSTFAAFGAIPVFVGLTYLGLWRFGDRRKA